TSSTTAATTTTSRSSTRMAGRSWRGAGTARGPGSSRPAAPAARTRWPSTPTATSTSATPDNARVQKFDPDGRFLMQVGGPGAGAGRFRAASGPYGLAVDRHGNVYALDLGGTLQKFDPAGRFVAKWTSTGGSRMMAVDERGDLYIRDMGSRSKGRRLAR